MQWIRNESIYCVKRISLGCFLRMQKTQPVRKIYILLHFTKVWTSLKRTVFGPWVYFQIRRLFAFDIYIALEGISMKWARLNANDAPERASAVEQ